MVFVRKPLLPVLGLLAFLIPSLRAQQQRISHRVDDEDPRPVRGNIRPAVANGLARDQGEVSGSHIVPRMYLHFALTPAQQADLDQLLKAQQNRRSPQYRHFLSPQQYAARFGLNPADLAKVTNWLEDNGFSSLQVAQSRTWISFSGTAAQAASAFHTSLHHYSLHGESHIANATEPALPAALSGIVQNIAGLHNFPWKSRAKPLFTLAYSNNHALAPDDWTTIYNVKPLYGTGLDGTGSTIAVVGQTDIKLTDIKAFRSASGLPPNVPSIVVPTGLQDPGLQKDDEVEADLDLEWAGAIAPKAHIIFVTASATHGNGVFDSLAYTIDQSLADVVSISYGSCEADLSPAEAQDFDSMFQQATAQGMTIVAASGDDGAAGCDYRRTSTVAATHGLAVDFPAASPNVTGIGGTSFPFDSSYWSSTNNGVYGSALGYIPESAWNDGFQMASGGGTSTLYTKPIWQTGPGVPADNARYVPDLSFAAQPQQGLLICNNGSCVTGFRSSSSDYAVIGGTSAGAPPFAGVLALLVQKNAGVRLGNINPNLYSLAQISSNAFHDVTSGDNLTFCDVNTSPDCGGINYGRFGFITGPGYDQVTGWGSIDSYQFVEQWNGDIQISANPTSLTINPGTSATATITVAPQNNFTGPISFSCSVNNGLVDVTCSIPPGTVNTSGTTTVTITAARSAHMVPPVRFVPLTPVGNTWLLTFGVGGGMLVFYLSKRPLPRSKSIYATVIASVLAIAIVSCGGSSSGGGGSLPPGPAFILSCNLPATAVSGSFYSGGSCSVSGAVGLVNFSVITGTLPDGLSLDSSSGAISGIPTTVGTNSFTVRATDGASHTGTSAQTLTVGKGPLSLFCDSPSGSVSKLYSAKCNALGGTAPFTYAVSSGSLPPGLAIDAKSGLISGVPSTYGFYTFDVTVTDSSSPVQTITTTSNSLYIFQTSPLALYCNGAHTTVGATTFANCFGVGGNSPYTYSFIQGLLPPGLAFDPASAAVTGKPTTEGSYAFIIGAADSSTPPMTTTQIVNFVVGPRADESDRVIITATSGAIVNTVGISVYVPQRTTP